MVAQAVMQAGTALACCPWWLQYSRWLLRLLVYVKEWRRIIRAGAVLLRSRQNLNGANRILVSLVKAELSVKRVLKDREQISSKSQLWIDRSFYNKPITNIQVSARIKVLAGLS